MVRSQNNWEWQQHHSPPEDDEDDNVDYREGKVSHYNKQASSSWAYIYITPSNVSQDSETNHLNNFHIYNFKMKQ